MVINNIKWNELELLEILPKPLTHMTVMYGKTILAGNYYDFFLKTLQTFIDILVQGNTETGIQHKFHNLVYNHNFCIASCISAVVFTFNWMLCTIT